MAKISDVEIARLARAAGFKHEAPIRGAGIASVAPGGGELVVMVAVALAESRGESTAFNPRGRDLSYGLWQINMLDSPGQPLGTYRRQKYGLSKNDDLFHPATNARVAYGVYSTEGSLGVKHWSVWNSKSYAFYLTRARKAVAAAGEDVPEGSPGWEDIPGGESVEDGINSITDAVKGIANFFTWISDGKNWVRVGLFLGGGVLLLGGLIFAFGKEADIKQAASLLPAGKALKSAAGK